VNQNYKDESLRGGGMLKIVVFETKPLKIDKYQRFSQTFLEN